MLAVARVAVVLADERQHFAEAAVELVFVSGLGMALALALTSGC